MSEAWAYKLGVVIALLIAAAVTGIAVALFRSLVWWPALLLQTPYRAGLVFFRLFVVFLVAAIVPLLALPSGIDIGVIVLLWLTVVPGLAERWARAAAWKRDSEQNRFDAAAIRRSIKVRRGDDQPFNAGKPWPEYIVDQARLERRRRYRPPGH